MTPWERCKPWIESALPYTGGAYAIADIENEMRANRMALMAGERSAMVIEIRQYPRFRDFHIFLAGGDLKELLKFHEVAHDAARLLGCKRISTGGRASGLDAGAETIRL